MTTQLNHAIKTRNDFIKSHPEAEDYQHELDLALSLLDNPLDRLAVILKKMFNNLDTISSKLEELSDELHTKSE